MSEKYNRVCERLWEKLTNLKHRLDMDCVNFSEPFPYDQFAKRNPIIKDFVREVEDEFDYDMSEMQCSWSVVALLRFDMAEYNAKTGMNLQPRA